MVEGFDGPNNWTADWMDDPAFNCGCPRPVQAVLVDSSGVVYEQRETVHNQWCGIESIRRPMVVARARNFRRFRRRRWWVEHGAKGAGVCCLAVYWLVVLLNG